MPKKKARSMSEDLKTLIDRLPPEMEYEVRAHIENLLSRIESGCEHAFRCTPKLHCASCVQLSRTAGKGRSRKLRLDWAGGLKEYRDRYTSRSLQKRILEWWAE